MAEATAEKIGSSQLQRDNEKYKSFLYFHYHYRNSVEINDEFIIYDNGQLLFKLLSLISDCKVFNITNLTAALKRFILNCSDIVKHQLKHIISLNSTAEAERYLNSIDCPDVMRLEKKLLPYYKELLKLDSANNVEAKKIIEEAMTNKQPPKVSRMLPMAYTTIEDSKIAASLNNTFRSAYLSKVFYIKFYNLYSDNFIPDEKFMVHDVAKYEKDVKYKSRYNTIEYGELAVSFKTGEYGLLKIMMSGGKKNTTNKKLPEEESDDSSNEFSIVKPKRKGNKMIKKIKEQADCSSKQQLKRTCTKSRTSYRESSDSENSHSSDGNRKKVDVTQLQLPLYRNTIMNLFYEIHLMQENSSSDELKRRVKVLRNILEEHNRKWSEIDISNLPTLNEEASTSSFVKRVPKKSKCSSDRAKLPLIKKHSSIKRKDKKLKKSFVSSTLIKRNESSEPIQTKKVVECHESSLFDNSSDKGSIYVGSDDGSYEEDVKKVISKKDLICRKVQKNLKLITDSSKNLNKDDKDSIYVDSDDDSYEENIKRVTPKENLMCRNVQNNFNLISNSAKNFNENDTPTNNFPTLSVPDMRQKHKESNKIPDTVLMDMDTDMEDSSRIAQQPSNVSEVIQTHSNESTNVLDYNQYSLPQPVEEDKVVEETSLAKPRITEITKFTKRILVLSNTNEESNEQIEEIASAEEPKLKNETIVSGDVEQRAPGIFSSRSNRLKLVPSRVEALINKSDSDSNDMSEHTDNSHATSSKNVPDEPDENKYKQLQNELTCNMARCTTPVPVQQIPSQPVPIESEPDVKNDDSDDDPKMTIDVSDEEPPRVDVNSKDNSLVQELSSHENKQTLNRHEEDQIMEEDLEPFTVKDIILILKS